MSEIDEMEKTGANDKNDETCKPCKMNKTMVGLAVAHLACSSVEDEDKRGECMAWANAIEPEQVNDVKDLMKTTYKKTGIEGLAVMPKLYDQLVRTVVIEEIGGKLERGEPVSDNEMKAYQEFTEEDAKRGI